MAREQLPIVVFPHRRSPVPSPGLSYRYCQTCDKLTYGVIENAEKDDGDIIELFTCGLCHHETLTDDYTGCPTCGWNPPEGQYAISKKGNCIFIVGKESALMDLAEEAGYVIYPYVIKDRENHFCPHCQLEYDYYTPR
jgi:hypothetical protein